MAERIPQSVAYLVVFRAYLSSDGKTPATGKTIAITLSKNGATSFSNPNAGATNATEMASGFYKFTLDTTDTGTAGPLAWRGTNADINDAGDVLTVANAHNAGFDGVPNAAAEATGGLYTRGTGAGQINQDANGRIDANVKTWIGGTIPAVNVTGVPLVDAKYLLGTVFPTPTVAGVPNVNTKTINDVATTSVTTVSANVGTTQPVNFTGTGASALAKSDMVDLAGSAVATGSAQLGVNVVNWSGTAVASPNTAGVPVVDTRLTVRAGTAQTTGNTTTAIKLDSGASATTDFYKYHRITVVSGTGSPESAICTAYNGSTKVATVAPAWPTAPDNTSVFVVTTDAQADVETWLGTAPLALSSQQVQAIVPDTQKVDLNTIKTQAVTCSGGVTVPAATLASTTNITAGTVTTATSVTNRVTANVDQVDGAALGTHGSGYFPGDVRQFGGTAGTFASGRPEVNTTHLAGTASAGAAGYVGLDWGHITAPTTVVALSGTTVGTVTTYTGNTPQTGDSYARIGAAGAGLTALGDTRIAHLDADVSSRMATYTQPTGFLAATFPATVASTTNITAAAGCAVSSIGAGVITAASIAADAIDADALAADAVTEIQSGLSTLTAAGVRTAVGLATANLDAQLAASAPVHTGTAQSGSTSSIILDAGASSVNDFYTGCLIRLTGGTGAGQVRLVADYLAAGKQVAVDRDFVTAPDGTTTFAILPALAPFMDSALRVTAAYVAGDVNGTVTPADGSITDAKFTVPAAAAGRPTGMLSMLRRVFEWRSNKRTRDRTTGNKILYDTDGTTALETQVQSTTSTVDQETQGA